MVDSRSTIDSSLDACVRGTPLADVDRILEESPLIAAVARAKSNHPEGDGRSFPEALPDVVWADAEGTIRWAGGFARAPGEPTFEALVGTPLVDLPHVCRTSRPTLASLVADTTEQHPIEAAIMVGPPGGSRSAMTVLAMRTRCPEGETRLVVWLTRPRGLPDLARLRELDHLATTGRMALSVASELNNVMVAVTLGIDALARADHEETDVVRDLRQMARRAAQLIRRVHDTRVVPSNRVDTLDLGDLLRRLRVQLTGLVGERTWLSVTCGTRPIGVRASRVALEQVLVNLVRNAADAARGTGNVIATATTMWWPGGRVTSGGYLASGEYAVLQISDDGPGIEAAALARVFEPFFSSKSMGTSTGVGLTLVAEVALDLGGGVIAESPIGGGTIFRVLLPLAA
jgi:signal transduction histidine kinase